MIPKVSIVTINLNNRAGLEKTIRSVTDQTFTDYEYIVIDGGSADGSLDLLNENADLFKYWVSEKDKGIFSAMNKGIKQAAGNFLFFLNSGDVFNDPLVLEQMTEHADQKAIVYGNLLICEPSRQWVKKYNEQLTFEYFIHDTLPHQGALISRELFDTMGLYDETLKISSDWKFFLLAVHKYKVEVAYLDRVVAQYDYSGISSDPDNYSLRISERTTVLEEEFGELYEMFRQMIYYRQKYTLLSSSRIVKGYLAIKKLLGRSSK